MTANRRLLVVDDDAALCEVYRAILTGEGGPARGVPAARLDVDIVHDGAAALDAVTRARRENRPYCGGFFDLVMPGTPDGLGVLRELRDIDRQLFCCVVTGTEGEVLPELNEIFREREQDWEFLRKPADAGEIYVRGRTMVARWNRRRLAEERAERRDALASLGMLVAGLAHEIKSPVAFVQSNVETLGSYGERLRSAVLALTAVLEEAETGAVAPDTVAAARTALRRHKIDFVLGDLADLIGQTLDGLTHMRNLTRAMKGLSPTGAVGSRVDVNECCERSLLVAGHALRRHCEVVREYGELPPWSGNSAELTQILVNLLVNAAHATQNRGTVTIRTRHDDGGIAIDVEDTGTGIPESIRDQIFDPFFTTKSSGEGAGLGLALAADLVARAGGAIDVDSEVGQGTRFTLRFPVEDRS